jgi:hypothetical protein
MQNSAASYSVAIVLFGVAYVLHCVRRIGLLMSRQISRKATNASTSLLENQQNLHTMPDMDMRRYPVCTK